MGRRARVSRKEVLNAAREVFSERGFAGATLAAVAAKVGLTPAALLRHAATKEELFQSAMSEKDEADPLAFLSSVPATEDPARVLRRVARELIAYGEKQIRMWMVLDMHHKSSREYRVAISDRKAKVRREKFEVFVDYMKRASRAGRLDLKDPRAAALLFAGGIQSYVLLHHVLRVIEPPLPVDRYLDTLIEVWTRGAISRPRRRR